MTSGKTFWYYRFDILLSASCNVLYIHSVPFNCLVTLVCVPSSLELLLQKASWFYIVGLASCWFKVVSPVPVMSLIIILMLRPWSLGQSLTTWIHPAIIFGIFNEEQFYTRWVTCSFNHNDRLIKDLWFIKNSSTPLCLCLPISLSENQ